jgi:hypothetical protein
MSDRFSRKVQDRNFMINRALPTADGTVVSADLDLQSGVKPENMELEITIPPLNATQLPNGDTLTITIRNGAAAAPTAVLHVLPVITGSSGYAGGKFRYRFPSTAARFANVQVVAAGGTGDISGATMNVKLLF